MAKINRLMKSVVRLVTPTIILVLLALGVSSIWLVHETSRPFANTYLVTPEKYGQLSSRGAQVTNETWPNKDGTTARGWLLRGTPNGPGVILLHRYGADRSHVLNLAVKLNEATNFTVLMPDFRGHGENPSPEHSTFGGCEGDDILTAAAYLKSLRSPEELPLVGQNIGVYGLEMGALAGLYAASTDQSIKALVLDSVPQDSDSLMASVIKKRYPFASSVTSQIASLGTYPYYYPQGCYQKLPACEVAKKIGQRRTLLLSGIDVPDLQDSTAKLGKCFPATTTVDLKTDLSPSGMGMTATSIELSEAYDQRVIDFLKAALTLQ